MSAHEFSIHERVNELFKLLGIPKTKAKVLAPNVTTFLENNRQKITSPVVICQAKEKITGLIKNPEDFIQKYDELNVKNVRELDQLVWFLGEVIDKNDMKQFLSVKPLANSTALDHLDSTNIGNGTSIATSGSSGSKLSSSALAEMKEKVLKNTSSNVIQVTPSILSSLSKMGLSEKNTMRSKKKEESHVNPDFPAWNQDRLYLSWDFYPNPEKFESDSQIDKLSLSMQEDMIIEDLLNCMLGVEGKFIKTPSLKYKHDERTFHIDRSLDLAMREVARRIIPVCSNYSLIIRFVEEKCSFKWGLVNHALCSAIKELLKNHHVFVSQLENLHRNGILSLQKLWYYVSPIMGFMDILAVIIKNINKGDLCGSAILNLLFDKVLMYSGDAKNQELIFYLAQTASRPYMTMLEDWIYKGLINDPYNEFMINEDKDINKDKIKEDFNEKFWEKKYSVNRNNVPKFMDQLTDHILLTGKYLNAISETGKSLFKVPNENNEIDSSESNLDFKNYVPNAKEILFTTKEEIYKQIVDNSYNFSSKVLLNLLLKDHKLIDRLRSLKHYFLHDQSDFMVHFMDIAAEEMDKDISEIKLNRLESLLELSLRITSANSDPYKDDLKVKLFPNDLKTMIKMIQGTETHQDIKAEAALPHINGLMSFSLDYVVKWPLSLIINRRTLFKYQILFRHIFLLKDVERQLCNVWLCTKSGEFCLGRSYKYYSMACALKQRMLNFVQNLLNYMTFEVFESSWNVFEENIRNVNNIDDVIKHHTTFLDTCLRDCIVTSDSFQNIQKILSVCKIFSAFVQSITQDSRMKEENAKFDYKLDSKSAKDKRKNILKEISMDLNEIVNSPDFSTNITMFNNEFSGLLLDLLGKIIDEMSNGLGQTKIGNVLYRLDFNDHYRDQLEELKRRGENK